MLHSAVERPATYVEYDETYTLDTVCALLLDSVARYHGFNDGNKRTALLTVLFTYRLNDIYFAATVRMNKDFDDTVMWVVTDKPDIDEISLRLKSLRDLHGVQNHKGWSQTFNYLRNRFNG